MPSCAACSSSGPAVRLTLLLGVLLAVHAAQAGDGGGGKVTWDTTWMDRLRRDMFTGYDKLARPAPPDIATNVTLGLSVTHLDIDEMSSVMIFDGWTKLSWTDTKLKWTPSDYGGLTHIHVSDMEVWKPDVVLYNNALGSDIEHYGHTNCILYNDGRVLWVPPSQFKAYCDLDLRRWPRDLQTCIIKMGSWTHNADQINLQIREEKDHENYMMTNQSEWELVEMSHERNIKYYPCCPEPYADITYTIELHRRSPSFFSLIVVPAAAVVVLTLSGFWMSPQSGERVVLNALTALIVCDLQRAVSQKLPDASGATPYILLFYSSSLALATLALVVSVTVLHLSRSSHTQPPSALLRAILAGTVGRILCIAPQGRGRKDTVESASGDTAAHQAEWLRAAHALDRLGFMVCTGVFVILCFALI